MPLISIVLPTYDVAGYLRECLDSVLGQSFRDLEVVAVDDCSPDGSGAILDEYAHRDPRVTVIHLDRNVGLGGARNVGLDAARGDYVWFVDSDDRLPSGALRAIAAKLTALRPHVLLVDHARLSLDQHLAPSILREAVPEAAAEGTFGAERQPEVLQLLQVAWNKIVHRGFLTGLGLRFRSGWYEDTPFTYPLLLATDRLALLPRVCYHYRQRRVGAITGTTDERHFELFDQYERCFATLDEWGVGGPAQRTLLFERMIWHYGVVLWGTARVPRDRRRAFFLRVAEHYRRYRPADRPVPTGLDGVKHRLLAVDGWRVSVALRTAYAAGAATRRRGRGVVRVAGRLARVLARRTRSVAGRGWYALQRRLPVDDRLAVYSAYWNRGYSCNPAAIYEAARHLAPHVRGVWVVNRAVAGTVPPGVEVVIPGTWRYYRTLARARWLVNNVNFPDFVVKRPGTLHVQTHHGTPLKAMGMDLYRYPVAAAREDLPAMLRRCDRWDLSIAAGPLDSEVWQRAYPCRHEILEVGYPRNDRLVRVDEPERDRLRVGLGLRPDETVVLYAPTHRDYLSGDASLLDVEELAEALGPRVRVLTRRHYFHATARTGVDHPRLLDVSAHPRVEDLLLAADVLVTDYSSVMFDFAHLDRPIVVFAPDWDAYRRTRGVTFDLMADPPGVVATSFAELVDAFGTGAVTDESATKARAAFRARHCVANDGRASERVVRHVFLGEPAPRPHRSPPSRPVAPAQYRGPEVPQDAPTARAGGEGGVRSVS